MAKINLCGAWKGKCIFPNKEEFSYEGTVPGSAINDLITIGKLPKNVFWEKNADSVVEYENCDYVYTKKFNFSGNVKRARLVFERIDTYCDVFLNGVKIHHSENGNIKHVIPVADSIKEGENLLEVKLYSPVEWVKDMPLHGGAFTCERMNTRRTQCTYSWDWVARFVTCGLGKCWIETYEEEELFTDDVYIVTLDADSESATVRADVGFAEKYNGRLLTFSLIAPDGKTACKVERFCKEPFIRTYFDVPNPQLWYPLGYGEQPLYTFILSDGDKVVYTEKIGVRTVKIMQLPDEEGSVNYEKCLSVKNKEWDFNEAFSGFILKVNGVKISCKGANWVPCEPFTTGDVSEKQTEILELCAEAGLNMIRIWGGGAFESKHFYDECSRLGITVTQDFLMACGSYPEDEDWFIEELKKEAKYAARLMRNQPCLMWWSGDNENAVNGCDTDENYQGRRSAYEGIAPILYNEDPMRRFLPSSPFGGKKYASNTVGTTHNTQYLGEMFGYFLQDDCSDYKEFFKKFRARFIAEEPQMGAISLPSLKKIMGDEYIYEGDEMWLYHTKTNPCLPHELYEYIVGFARAVLGDFKDGKDRVFKFRYIQYEWIRVVMEQMRREKGFCSGIVYWMLNDCWPAASGWSLIDFYNLPKDAYYSFKRCAKPVVSSIDKENGAYYVYVSNDSPVPQKVRGLVSLIKNGRETGKTWEINALVGTEKAELAQKIGVELEEGDVLVCNIFGDWGTDRAFYKKGALPLVETAVDYSINEVEKTMTFSSKSYVHAVTVSGNAVFEDNCFSLMPGESKTVSYELKKDGNEAEFTVEAYTL